VLDLTLLLLAGLGTGYAALALAERIARRPAPASGLGHYLPVALHWAVLALVLGAVFGTGLWLAG
jgi:hypothetical protein